MSSYCVSICCRASDYECVKRVTVSALDVEHALDVAENEVLAAGTFEDANATAVSLVTRRSEPIARFLEPGDWLSHYGE